MAVTVTVEAPLRVACQYDMPLAVPVCQWPAPGGGAGGRVDSEGEGGGRKPKAGWAFFSAQSWGYSALQYIMEEREEEKKRCAAASQGLKIRLPRPFGPRQ